MNQDFLPQNFSISKNQNQLSWNWDFNCKDWQNSALIIKISFPGCKLTILLHLYIFIFLFAEGKMENSCLPCPGHSARLLHHYYICLANYRFQDILDITSSNLGNFNVASVFRKFTLLWARGFQGSVHFPYCRSNKNYSFQLYIFCWNFEMLHCSWDINR